MIGKFLTILNDVEGQKKTSHFPRRITTSLKGVNLLKKRIFFFFEGKEGETIKPKHRVQIDPNLMEKLLAIPGMANWTVPQISKFEISEWERDPIG